MDWTFLAIFVVKSLSIAGFGSFIAGCFASNWFRALLFAIPIGFVDEVILLQTNSLRGASPASFGLTICIAGFWGVAGCLMLGMRRAKRRARKEQPPIESEAQKMVAAARQAFPHAASVKELAESALKRKLSDTEWAKLEPVWAPHWREVAADDARNAGGLLNAVGGLALGLVGLAPYIGMAYAGYVFAPYWIIGIGGIGCLISTAINYREKYVAQFLMIRYENGVIPSLVYVFFMLCVGFLIAGIMYALGRGLRAITG